MFSSFNPFVSSLPKQQKTANSFSVVTLSFVTKLNHYLWAYVNAKLFYFFGVTLKYRDSASFNFIETNTAFSIS